jgi:hypothetical protein
LGKSAPTPPQAPDPNTIIDAETNASDQAAATQSSLNNVNYQGPQGSVTYSMNSPDRWTEDVQLNPTEQATYDTTQNADYRAAKVADNQILNVSNALQSSNLQAPTLQTGAPTGNLATGYNSGGAIQYGFNPGGPIQSQVAPTYSPFGTSSLPVNPYGTGASMGVASQPSSSPPTLAQAQSALGSGGAGASNVGAYESWLGSGQSQLPAAQQAQLAQLQQQNPNDNQAQLDYLAFGANNGAKGQSYLQSLGAQGAQPSAPAPSSQTAQPAAQNGYGQAPSSLASVASNPVLGTQLATYDQAAQLLNPQWQQTSEQQQAQLTAQGLNPNSAAYQNSMTLFGNQENEAYDQAAFNAVNAGDAEQNTLYGQNLSSAQFANQAQAQQYGENQSAAQFNNTAQAQANSQNAAAAAFQNQAAGQNWQEQYQNAQLANQAAQQQFQDQAYATQLPINEFTALLGDSQVAMPPSSPAQNTTVQTPNVSNAYELQQAGQQFDYSANQQNEQSGLTGLFNLGNAVLSLPGL